MARSQKTGKTEELSLAGGDGTAKCNRGSWIASRNREDLPGKTGEIQASSNSIGARLTS